MINSNLYWQTYLNLEKEMLEIAKVIYITDENKTKHLNVYSSYIADLLVRTCVEIETLSKEIYFKLGGPKQRGDRSIRFDSDCLQLMKDTFKSDEKMVLITNIFFHLTKKENYSFFPLKKAEIRQGADWNQAYQALKHDKYNSLEKGTLGTLIHALGALFLLSVYYRDVKLVSKFNNVDNLDYSFGSMIFSIPRPSHKYVVDIINNKEIPSKYESNESLLILKLTDNSVSEVKKANEESLKFRNYFINNQPELHDSDFIEIVNNGLQKEKINPNDKFMMIWELFKYRINKKIPNYLSFEERKKLFINSEEWNCRTRLISNHLNENDLTEKNIQFEIDNAGLYMGMEIDSWIESKRIRVAFEECDCEIIVDKGNKYQSAIED